MSSFQIENEVEEENKQIDDNLADAIDGFNNNEDVGHYDTGKFEPNT